MNIESSSIVLSHDRINMIEIISLPCFLNLSLDSITKPDYFGVVIANKEDELEAW